MDAPPFDAARVTALRGSFALVDLETTGGHAAFHRVIEVGIVSYEQGRIVDEWSSLVNPGIRIPGGIQSFTGITDAMVADAPPFAAIAADVRTRLANRMFVAHNARFDHGFLRTEFRRLGERLSVPVLCTVRLSRAFYPDQVSHSLDALIERHGLACSARHRALGDARVLAGFLERVVACHGAQPVESAIARLSAGPALPPQLPADLPDDLPEGPGVYFFYGQGGTLLYVGKSTNIRTRVLQHFAAGQRTEQRLARRVTRVDWSETAGELGALLRAARLVRQLQPTANRRLRRSEGCYTIRLEPHESGLRARVERFDLVDFTEAHGLFCSHREAVGILERVVREHALCRKLLGLESATGTCLAFQLGRCRGSCAGGEPIALHDTRVRLALQPQRLQSWPFAGPVGVRERGLVGEEIHVFDRWHYLGSARSERELASLQAEAVEIPFDPDVYRILRRALTKTATQVFELRGGAVRR